MKTAILVIPNLFRDKTMPTHVILKQVQDDQREAE